MSNPGLLPFLNSQYQAQPLHMETPSTVSESSLALGPRASLLPPGGLWAPAPSDPLIPLNFYSDGWGTHLGFS